MYKDFLEFIKTRGYFNQCTNEEDLKKKSTKQITGYIGFDCTSDSLHVGSLLPLMLLRIFQKFGHKPIILLGGGTTLIGDPSGKDETRKILDQNEINKNKKKLTNVFKKFLNFDPKIKNSAIIVDNLDWLGKLNFISFLRQVGSKFSVNRMLALESIKQRLQREQNLSFLEFNYSVVQAYDFLELFNRHNCILQFGGSDQWGNIVSGIDLIKKESREEVFGLTSPLITTSTGAKMGKSSDGAIWLSEDKLNCFDFWQYWRNTDDQDILRFLKLFTEIPNKTIKEYESNTNLDINELKIVLANEVTSYLHGHEKTKRVAHQAKKIIASKSFDPSLITDSDKKIQVSIKKVNKGLLLKQALLDLNLSSSISDSKRLISQGAIKVNNNSINDKEFLITVEHFISDPKKNSAKLLLIHAGKKKFGLIELV